MLSAGQDLRRVPDGVRGHDRRVRGPEAPEHRGHHRHHRPLPPRPHGLHPPVHRLQAQLRSKINYKHPVPGADPLRHLRLHRLPGAGDPDLPAAGGLLPGPGGHGAPGHLQEKGRQTSSGSGRPSSTATRSGTSPGCVANGIPEADGPGHLSRRSTTLPTTPSTRPTPSAYAVVAYQTAWFKCHYTREYMAALLTSRAGQLRQGGGAISAECRDCGIALLPPDINRSADRLHRGGGRHPLRPGGHQEHRPGLYPGRDAGAGAGRPFTSFYGLLRPDVGQRHQQAGGGEPDPLRRL